MVLFLWTFLSLTTDNRDCRRRLYGCFWISKSRHLQYDCFWQWTSLSYWHLIWVSNQTRRFKNTKSKSFFNMTLFEGGKAWVSDSDSYWNTLPYHLNIFVLEHSYWLIFWTGHLGLKWWNIWYWNIVIVCIFFAGISLLSEYVVVESSYWLNV